VHYLAPFGFSAMQMTFFRAVVSTFILCIYILVCDRSLFRISVRELLLFAGSGLSFFCTASFYYAAMQVTSISTAVVLMYTAPIMVMIYSVLFLGEKLTPLKTVSVVCMLVGCSLVSGIVGGMKFDAFGIVLGLLSGVSYSAYNIFTKIQMRHKSHPISATFYCFLFATLIGVLGCSVAEIPGYIAVQPTATVPLIMGLGVCTCILPYFLYTMALKYLPVGTAAALGIVEPMAATIFSVVLFHEPLNVFSACGIILIFGAVFLLSRSEA